MRALMYTTMMIAIVGARTASADDRADAHAHVASATAFHKVGRFADALVELEAAYELDPKPPLLFAMGQLHARLGHCQDAVAFYNRFLATHPAVGPMTMATEAIAACKVDPTPAIVDHELAPPVGVDVAPPPAPPIATAPIVVHYARPWYRDRVGDALVVGGLVVGVAAAVVYRKALVDRDRADGTRSYDGYASQIDSAHAERTYAIVLGAAGVGLLVGGGLHYLLADRGHTEVQIAPERGGGTVSFGGRF